jgi:hypothetical protein
VAAMPSVGRIRKVWVFALAAAALAISASTASANPAWVWACHGPNGGSILTDLQTGQTGDGEALAFDGGCAGADDAGYALRFTRPDPASNSKAELRLALPPGVTASKVVIVHEVHGSSAGARYRVSLGGGGFVDRALATPTQTPSPEEFTVSGSGTLTFSLTCEQAPTCAQGAEPVSVDIVKVGVLVDDQSAPRGGVTRNTPVDKLSELIPSVSETGVGLSHAEVLIAPAPGAAPVFARRIEIGTCTDLSPADPTRVDLPLNLISCPTKSKDDCSKRPQIPCDAIAVDTTALPAGIYYRTVRVYDAAGNQTNLLQNGDQEYEPFEVWHPVLGSPTQTLSIGSSGVAEPQPSPNTNPNSGGVGGAQNSSCRSPRLSVSLDQKPLRISKGVPVLQYGKRYRFEGRLTCVINGKRKSAPKRTRVEILNKVGKKTVTKPATKVADKGLVRISLKYPVGTRTLIFRSRNPDGQRSQVSIKIKVEKKKTSKR